MSYSKTQIREYILKQRLNIDQQQHADWSGIILKKASTLITELAKPADIIGIYWPIAGEPDIFRIAAKHNTTMALPQINDSCIRFVKYIPEEQLQRYRTTQIYQPVSFVEVTPSIIFLPGLVFSIDGYRIGFGKGLYDKYLAKIRLSQKITAIGVCFQENLFRNIPSENWDQKLDYVITEQLLIKCI